MVGREHLARVDHPVLERASSAQDTDVTAPGKFFLYLVTVRNRLGEEGTKGFSTNGERPNPTPCP